jgi:hypothetical protein
MRRLKHTIHWTSVALQMGQTARAGTSTPEETWATTCAPAAGTRAKCPYSTGRRPDCGRPTRRNNLDAPEGRPRMASGWRPTPTPSNRNRPPRRVAAQLAERTGSTPAREQRGTQGRPSPARIPRSDDRAQPRPPLSIGRTAHMPSPGPQTAVKATPAPMLDDARAPNDDYGSGLG